MSTFTDGFRSGYDFGFKEGTRTATAAALRDSERRLEIGFIAYGREESLLAELERRAIASGSSSLSSGT